MNRVHEQALVQGAGHSCYVAVSPSRSASRSRSTYPPDNSRPLVGVFGGRVSGEGHFRASRARLGRGVV